MTTLDPKISVVTVIKNSERHLSGCLASVAAEREAGLEHVILDGASTDRTLEILRAEAGPQVRWFSEPDQGIYDAMNKAVAWTRGEWLLFLGVDDRLRPGSLSRVSERLTDPNIIYYGDAWMVRRRRRYDGPFTTFRLARRNLCQQAVLYPRKAFELHSFDLYYPIQADWVFNMQCWNDPRLQFEYIQEIIADYNDADGLSSRCRDLSIEQEYLRLLRANFPAVVAWPWMGVVGTGRLIKRLLPWVFKKYAAMPCKGGREA